MKNIFLTGIALLVLATVARASDSTAVQLVFSQVRTGTQKVMISIKAIAGPGIKLYGLQRTPGDLLYSSINFDSASKRHLADTIMESGSAVLEKDGVIDAEVRYYADSLLWRQCINAGTTDSVVIKGTVDYFYKKGEEYVPGQQPFKFFILPADRASRLSVGKDANSSPVWIFLTAFLGGLLALLTPCVYSMIPLTVSFFTKRSKTRKEGIRNAIFYSLSIVIIFTLLGFLMTFIFGPASLNKLATNWIANLIFFVLFLVFGISFLGAFEISLPSSWSTNADSRAGTGSFGGIFFMALTLAVVSFSCTGPIIGNLLVLAAKGSYWGPLAGMFGFSLALALPFALFAFFPSRINILGRAGGWLNAVKVSLGFLELALALKFLSNADLSRGWRLMDREIFIACWIVIFLLLGIYLLGKLKFHHDDDLPKNDFGQPYISVTRLFVAMAAFIFVVYMIPGLWGAPLKGISAFVPPMGTQDFNASAPSPNSSGDVKGSNDAGLPRPQKYSDQMKIYEPEVVTRFGLVTYYDYAEALEVARKLKKPLMVDFTGINCVNCRKMEGKVWSDAKVMQKLKEDFVVVSLYVDAHKIELPLNEQYFSNALEKQVETVGDRNTDLQVTKFDANSQPYYFFLDGNENKLIDEGYGYDPDIDRFINLLDEVKERYYRNR